MNFFLIYVNFPYIYNMINLKNILGFDKLVSIKLKEELPQVGSFILDYEINSDKILIKENMWLDFIIKEDGDVVIGHGHYKISQKSKTLKFAGRLFVLNGKIIKIDGDSGHYIPNESEVNEIKEFLNTNTELLALVELDSSVQKDQQ